MIPTSIAGLDPPDPAVHGPSIRVLVVDDHPLLREGIAAVLGAQPDMDVQGEATDGREAVELYARHHPDVVLMDLQMPGMDGIAAIEAIRQLDADARIVVLTTYRGDVRALRALRAGANGYLLKSMLRRELVETIRHVHAGGRRVPPEVAESLAAHVGEETLSTREIEVLREVANGNSNKAVARRLGITDETVKAHMKSLMAKLAANDRTHAVTIAIRRGIIQL
ncbi:response regulator [Marilutibacter aestuarii]|uniref:Response regulator transcription factor n=1 Tax=Marilutibacter aestuarii TaxID=1706195 RepID=A0A508AGP3_9GAMM|nr:response regulator transcription factor [Lysobacter aestuarii]TQD46335.1 response regulator transcription factor [Lysobacter aestuarii]